MNNTLLINLLRLVAFVLVQGLILQRINANEELFPYVHLIVYPLFIAILPLRTPAPLVIFASFVLGIGIDIFYSSYGIHAAAAVFTGYFRQILLEIIKPVDGYNMNISPTKAKMGANWFYRYMSILLLFHCFIYFSYEAFNISEIGSIILKSIFSFVVSIMIIGMYITIFNPKE